MLSYTSKHPHTTPKHVTAAFRVSLHAADEACRWNNTVGYPTLGDNSKSL